MEIGSSYGLEKDDIKSVSMGVSGEDVLLSPAARRILDLSIEAKAVEALNVHTTFVNHFEKYKDTKSLKLLVHTKNRSTPLVTLRFEDFLEVLKKGIGEPKT